MSLQETSTSPTRVVGFLPPIVTPMLDGKIDIKSLHAQLDYIADHVAGYLVGGSVGEVASLTVEERIQLMRACADHSGSTHKLAVSVSDNSVENTRRLCEVASEIDADLLMVSSPNYFANNREMLTEYFHAVSEFSPIDICLYDNPIQSHTLLSIADLTAIADAVPRLTHIKVTDTSVDKVALVCSNTDLVVLAGDDAVLWHQLDRGAEGGMVALPLIYPSLTSRLWEALQNGDRADAYAVYGEAIRFFHMALGAPDFVAVVKIVLHHHGIISSTETRLPLLPANNRRCAEIIEAL